MGKTNILNIYEYSAARLLNAMKLSIRLLDINRKLEERLKIIAPNDINLENNIKNYIMYFSEKKNLEDLINDNINQSCKSVISVLNNYNNLSIEDIKLIQELLGSITNFINKSHVRNFINLSPITVELVSTLNLCESKDIGNDKPQFILIVKKLREMYQLCLENPSK